MRRLRVLGLILTLIWQVGCSWTVAYAAGPACLMTASIAEGYAACIVVQNGGKSQVYRFNSELYRGRGIAVYGSPGAISAKQNTFVGRTKPDPSKPWTVAGGYYVWNGKKGEYRYHGFDASGNKFENVWFPDDVYVNPPEERTWVYRPWLNPNKVMASALNKPSTPGVYATALQVSQRSMTNGAQKAYEKFQQGLGWFPSAVYPAGTTGYRMEDFATVHQKTTTRNAGAASMWSYSAKTKKVWIQTFEIPQLVAGDKKIPAVTVQMSVKSKDREAQPFDFLKSKTPGEKTLYVAVTGILGDQSYVSGSPDEYLTRQDLLIGKGAWRIRLFDRNQVLLGTLNVNNHTFKNTTTGLVEAKGEGQLAIKVKPSQLSSGSFLIKAVVDANFVTGEKATGTGQIQLKFSHSTSPISPEELDAGISPKIPSKGFDVVAFPASDGTNMALVTLRSLKIDGVMKDAATFFSGAYVFGVGKHGNHLIEVNYEMKDGRLLKVKKWVYIADTLPNACVKLDGSFKVNRLITMSDCTATVNESDVMVAYPITQYKYEFQSIDGNLGSLRKLVDTNTSKKLVFKSKGSYLLTVSIKNSLGRTSELLTIRFEVMEDLPPNVVQHPFSGQVARNMAVTFKTLALSGDDDEVGVFTHQIYWDSNQDNIADTLVYTMTGALSSYKPTKLGMYEVRSTAVEKFMLTGLSPAVTSADFKSMTVKTYFLVENFSPGTELGLERLEGRKKVDLFFMLDGHLATGTTTYFNQHAVDIRNKLNSYGLDTSVRKWDGKLYVSSKAMQKSVDFGTTFPDFTYSYNAGGYAGVLPLSSVNTTTKVEDHGAFKTVTDKLTKSGTCKNRVYVNYDIFGNRFYQSSTSVCPKSIKYDDGRYSGTLYRTGENSLDPLCPSKLYPYARCSRLWTAYYSGVVTWVHDVWVEKWVKVNYYVGVYKGNVSTTSQEKLGDPFGRIGTTKWIVYVTADSITNHTELVKTQTVQSSRLLLIGNDAAAPLIAEDYFIRAGPDYEATIHQLAVYLLGENTAAEVKSILVNEPIQVQTGDYDTELDEIINPRWMIIHDQSTVDKPLGAYSQSTPLRNEAAWIAEKPIPFLDKPGSYELIRKVKDTPVTNCSTCDYGLDSNEASLKLFVHRQPIAQLLLTATYSSQNKNFHLVWQDISYDPDNAIRRADKGIVARQFRYHSVGQTSWKYTMPSVLTPGSYTAEFAVQDVNEAWSEDYSISFQLKSDGTVAYEIIPEINHTEGWQTYHLYRGDETNQAPKDFFAGEQLLLDAVLPSRNAEYIQASCQMMTVHDRIVTTSVRLQTRDNLGLQYGETLFNPAWSNPKDPIRKGLYQVTFTTKFKTGTTTVAEVPIRIIGSIYESYGVQRLK